MEQVKIQRGNVLAVWERKVLEYQSTLKSLQQSNAAKDKKIAELEELVHTRTREHATVAASLARAEEYSAQMEASYDRIECEYEKIQIVLGRELDAKKKAVLQVRELEEQVHSKMEIQTRLESNVLMLNEIVRELQGKSEVLEKRNGRLKNRNEELSLQSQERLEQVQLLEKVVGQLRGKVSSLLRLRTTADAFMFTPKKNEKPTLDISNQESSPVVNENVGKADMFTTPQRPFGRRRRATPASSARREKPRSQRPQTASSPRRPRVFKENTESKHTENRKTPRKLPSELKFILDETNTSDVTTDVTAEISIKQQKRLSAVERQAKRMSARATHEEMVNMRLNRQLQESKEQLDSMEAALAKQQEDNDYMRARLRNANKVLKKYKAELTQKDKEIDNLQQSVNGPAEMMLHAVENALPRWQ